MSKAVLVMDMPSCCEECFALDFHGDYPRCMITDEQRGYTFNTRSQRMTYCPLKTMPVRDDGIYLLEYSNGYQRGWNDCIKYLDT